MADAPTNSDSRREPQSGKRRPSTRDPRTCFDREPARSVAVGSVRVSLYEYASERIFVVEPDDGAARANIFWVHGLTDHAARQFDSAVWLANLGYRTILFDLQGHGGRDIGIEESWWLKEAYLKAPDQSEVITDLIRRRSREGSLTETQIREAQYRVLARTTISDHFSQFDRVLTQLLESRWNDVPFYLFGHSMGGLICVEGIRRYQLRSRANFGGLILMAPGFKPVGRPGRRVENAVLEGFWRLSNRRSPLSVVRPLAKRVLDLNFPIDVTWGFSYVSDDSPENELIDKDPLTVRRLPSAYFSSIESQAVQTNQYDLGFLPDTLVLVPQEDAIVNTEASLLFAKRARQSMNRNAISVVRFPYLRAHNLLRASVRIQARNFISDWLDDRAA